MQIMERVYVKTTYEKSYLEIQLVNIIAIDTLISAQIFLRSPWLESSHR